MKSGELLMVPCLRNLLYVPSIKPVLYGGYAGFHSNSLVYIYDVLSAGISQRFRFALLVVVLLLW